MMACTRLVLLFAVLLVSMSVCLPPVAALSLPKRATTCNGSNSLCQKLYSNVTFAGAHSE